MKILFTARLILLALVASFLIACEKTEKTDIKKQITYVTGQWERITDSVINDPDLPGMIIGIWVPDKNIEWVRSKGYTDRQTWEAPDANMSFRIGNVSESFASVLLLQLVDQEKLALDDSLSKYLPDFPKADSIRLHMLLNHASGIPDYLSSNLAGQAYKHPERSWSREELIAFAGARPFYFTPGTDYQYSATNALVAAAVMEKVTGSLYKDLLKERILDSLGLTNTSFPVSASAGSSFFKGYTIEDEKVVEATEIIHPSFYGEAAGMVSNMYDLKTWIELVCNGTILSATTREKMFTLINAPGAMFQQNGLGIMYDNSPPKWGHAGSVYGYSSLVFYAPEQKLTMVIAFNNTRVKPMVLASRLMEVYLDNINN